MQHRIEVSLLAALAALGVAAPLLAGPPPLDPCRTPLVDFAPAPIEAGHAAIRWTVSSTALTYTFGATRLVGADGVTIGLSVAREPDSPLGISFLLRPDAPIAPGEYKLEYTTSCIDAPATTNVNFLGDARPNWDALPALSLQGEKSCSDFSTNSIAVSLPLGSSFDPLLPFVRTQLVAVQNGAARNVGDIVLRRGGQGLFFAAWTACGFGTSPASPRVALGPIEFRMIGTLVDGPEVFRKTVTGNIECVFCEAGTSSPPVYDDAGISSARDASRTNVRETDSLGCYCAVLAERPTRARGASPFVAFGALVALAVTRQRRRAKASTSRRAPR